MVRPRWHDALIVTAIVGLLGTGIWAFWWDDVRRALFGPGSGSQMPTSAPATADQT